MSRKIALIQLNEINFEMVQHYIDLGNSLPVLQKINNNKKVTIEDEEYKNLEPWIQWYSIYSGKKYKEHKVFHLGDGYKQKEDTIFTDLQKKGYKVGAIAPMNLSSSTASFDFFMPDPWSDQKPVGGVFVDWIFDAIKQAVNDNSGGGITKINKIKLLLGILKYLSINELKDLVSFYTTINGKSYRKAMFLDLLLVKLHQTLSTKNSIDFSSVFLNAGAHIQHHYLYNSSFTREWLNKKNPEWYIDADLDPIKESIMFYEKILASYEKLGFEIIIATGLQQVPYVEDSYYYRLDNHEEFFKKFGIKFKRIFPRMTRDFELSFDNVQDCNQAIDKFDKFIDKKGNKVFGEISKTSETTAFCTLVYNKEISPDTSFFYADQKFCLFDHVNFVAVKNGKHDKYGTFYYHDFVKLGIDEELLCVSDLRYYLANL